MCDADDGEAEGVMKLKLKQRATKLQLVALHFATAWLSSIIYLFYAGERHYSKLASKLAGALARPFVWRQTDRVFQEWEKSIGL